MKVTKKMRKALANFNRDEATLAYRTKAFPKPQSYYIGDVQHQEALTREFVKAKYALRLALGEVPDLLVAIESDIAVQQMQKRVAKHFNIKQQKPKAELQETGELSIYSLFPTLKKTQGETNEQSN